MDITLGQIRHAITGIGYGLVAAGIFTAEEAATGTNLIMEAVGAILAAAGHITSALNKRKAQ